MMTAEAALQSLSRVAFARWKSGGESNVFLCLPRKWKKMMPVDTPMAASKFKDFCLMGLKPPPIVLCVFVSIAYG